jgi:hypothetical protein
MRFISGRAEPAGLVQQAPVDAAGLKPIEYRRAAGFPRRGSGPLVAGCMGGWKYMGSGRVTAESAVGAVAIVLAVCPALLGQTVEPPFTIGSGSGSHTLPYAGYNAASNRWMVVWSTSSASTSWIHGQFVGPGANLSGPLLSISDPTLPGPGDLSYWQADWGKPLAYDAQSQRTLVTWYDTRQFTELGIVGIYGQLLAADGTLVGANIAISPSGIEDNHRASSSCVASNGQGSFLVLWTGPAPAYPFNIYGQIVTSGGSLSGPLLQYTQYASGRGAGLPDVLFNNVAGKYFAVWTYRDDLYLHLRIINQDGSSAGSDIPLIPYALGQGVSNLACDPVTGRFLVTSGTRGIMLNPDGSVYKPAFQLDARGSHYSQAVAFDTDHRRFLSVDVAGIGLYLNADASFYGRPFVTSQLGRFPDAAYSPGENKTLVVWDDGECFGQMITCPWHPADLDGDDDVDQGDVDVLTKCSSGPAITYSTEGVPPGCPNTIGEDGYLPGDFDHDHDVDSADFAVLQRCFSGSGVQPDLVCME